MASDLQQAAVAGLFHIHQFLAAAECTVANGTKGRRQRQAGDVAVPECTLTNGLQSFIQFHLTDRRTQIECPIPDDFHIAGNGDDPVIAAQLIAVCKGVFPDLGHVRSESDLRQSLAVVECEFSHRFHRFRNRNLR